MNRKKHMAIIYDLLALYQKYNEREVRDAIEAIQRGDALEEFLQLSKMSGRFASVHSETKKPSGRSGKRAKNSRDRLNEFIQYVEGRDNENSTKVTALIKAIDNRQVLHNSRALREFAGLLDVTVPMSKLDRPTVAKKIGEALLILPVAECERLCEVAMNLGQSVSSLREWSEIIVKK